MMSRDPGRLFRPPTTNKSEADRWSLLLDPVLLARANWESRAKGNRIQSNAGQGELFHISKRSPLVVRSFILSFNFSSFNSKQ